MRKFIVNGKEYTARAFDFNTVCDLEDMGISLEMMEEKPVSMLRAYFALCSNLNPADAGKQIELHLIGGGKMDAILNPMKTELNESDFFRALKAKAEEDTQENPSEEEQKQNTAVSDNF